MAPGENEFDTPVLNPLKEATAGLSEPPGPTLVSISLDSLLGFTWESPRPAQVAAISDCLVAQQGGTRQNIDGDWPWTATTT